ncbi:hypothetical protein RRG08_012264 [Elysia crispata]|uniref:Uncharacterized protein n=1 Tax=Elysia crispata TaxID=231223 RepID=A0AAE1BAH0_9GAST|nr:hypothetical protein RRG08_012264 [Elysia crispata]
MTTAAGLLVPCLGVMRAAARKTIDRVSRFHDPMSASLSLDNDVLSLQFVWFLVGMASGCSSPMIVYKKCCSLEKPSGTGEFSRGSGETRRDTARRRAKQTLILNSGLVI